MYLGPVCILGSGCAGSEVFTRLGVSATAGWFRIFPRGQSFRASEGPRLCGWVEGGQGPQEAGRGAGSAGQAPGRGEPPGLGAGRPGSLTSAKLAARRLAPDAHGAEGRREEGGGRVAAGRHGAWGPGPPPPPPDVAAAATAVCAGTAPIAAASGARGCR